MQTSKESRIHKFILRVSVAAKELDLGAMDRLGVKVKHAEYATEGEGKLLALVHLVDKLRKSDIVKKMFGGWARNFPYNRECHNAQAQISETDVVSLLVSSGDSKVEYQQVFAMHFVGGSATVVEADGSEKKKKQQTSSDQPANPVIPACSGDPLVSHKWGDADMLALREENRQLQAELLAATARLKELERQNSDLLAKKTAFDSLTAQYAAWRYDTRCKDERIAELEARNAELQMGLARMTECRDALLKKMGK